MLSKLVSSSDLMEIEVRKTQLLDRNRECDLTCELRDFCLFITLEMASVMHIFLFPIQWHYTITEKD